MFVGAANGRVLLLLMRRCCRLHLAKEAPPKVPPRLAGSVADYLRPNTREAPKQTPLSQRTLRRRSHTLACAFTPHKISNVRRHQRPPLVATGRLRAAHQLRGHLAHFRFVGFHHFQTVGGERRISGRLWGCLWGAVGPLVVGGGRLLLPVGGAQWRRLLASGAHSAVGPLHFLAGEGGPCESG